MCKLHQVTIVGLGLIGGSIARALRLRCPDVILVAINRDDLGAHPDVGSTIDHFVTLANVATCRTLISKSDIIVLCQPVRVIVESLSDYVSPNTVVTDTGSTKRQIVAKARSLPGQEWFVPGHPMAGREVGGFENSAPELFENRPWILCTEGREPTAVRKVEMLLEHLGARKS
ncbi:MAG: prephenate dehydrogenase/arogenate dehydrogenase family protein [Polyangiaceae bacterium]